MHYLEPTYYREGALKKVPRSFLYDLSEKNPKAENRVDYFTFGMLTPGRKYNGPNYSRGFNGMLKDDEVKGSGNSYTAEFWQYDSRLGRRWNLDPVVVASESGYAAFRNNPIWLNDPNGDCPDCSEKSEPNKHTIEKGETLTGIAKETGTTVDQLSAWNNIEDPDKIYAGNEIVTSNPNVSGNTTDGSNTNNSNDDLTGNAISGTAAATFWWLGSNSVEVGRAKTGGATPKTSIASKYLSKKLPQKIKSKPYYRAIPKRVTGMPVRSPVLGRTLGRVTPIIGYAAFVYDVSTYPWARAFEGYTVNKAHESVGKINKQTNEVMGTKSWNVYPRGVK